MSEQKTLERPRQVTVAAAMGAAGGAMLVLSLFDAMNRLRTVEMRAAIEEFLAEPPGDGLGVSTRWVVDALHGVVLVNGALAAVATVFAVYVFWRHHAARIGFTVAAGILLFTAPFSGGAFAVVLAFAATMLWSRPARDWFAGRAPEPPDPVREPTPGQTPESGHKAPSATSAAEVPVRGDGPRAPADASWPPPFPVQPAAGPDRPPADPASARPVRGFGDPDHRTGPVSPYQQPPATAARTSPDASVGAAGAPSPPAGVLTAAVVTWLFCALVLVFSVVLVAMLMVGQDVLLGAVEGDARAAELDLSDRDLLSVLWVAGAVLLVWCLSAISLAVLVVRRMHWARVGLTVSCVMTALLALSAGWAGVVFVVAAGATVALLFSGSANAWFAHGRSASARPPHDGPGGAGGDTGAGGRADAPPPSRTAPQQRPHGKPPVW